MTDRPDGTPYRPSNGTEGEIFESQWCERCKHDEHETGCDVRFWTFVHEVEHEDYPSEWIWRDGEPVCTAFQPTETGS